MIVYITTRYGRRAIAESLPHLPDALCRRFRLTTYGELQRRTWLPLATYIFADIDRMTPSAAERAAAIWESLASSGEPVRLLNHPTRSLTRTRLLQTLFRAGINDFNVHRADAPGEAIRYPVFLHGADDHNGARSDLIHDAATLESELRRVEAPGLPRSQCLVVEFCDTIDPGGIYRKYDAFIAGDRILPTDMYHSSRWMLKWENSGVFDATPIGEEALTEAELGYIHDFADHDRLREVAALARIDYGRIDFARRNGRIQIWEINTNPDLALGAMMQPDYRRTAYARQVLPTVLEKVFAMLASLDCDGDPAIRIPVAPR
ncbi:MAG: hypothetical protein SGJ07_08220 [Rhodospirillaceae bacterium]|nr:hypothetical protein [Rhodospirillaceae bacterium]